MSAFLGPIHHWLYNKIQLQQNIIDDLFTIGKGFGLSLQEECDTLYGSFENRPLEEMIDLTNIHGWLQERVSQVEYKYAYSVKKLLDHDSSIFPTLKLLLTSKGKALGEKLSKSQPSASIIYRTITDNLLDGMPCDHANRIVEETETSILWTRNLCVHSSYWEAVDGDINIYYELRNAWLEGMIGACGYELIIVDPATYSMKIAA